MNCTAIFYFSPALFITLDATFNLSLLQLIIILYLLSKISIRKVSIYSTKSKAEWSLHSTHFPGQIMFIALTPTF